MPIFLTALVINCDTASYAQNIPPASSDSRLSVAIFKEEGFPSAGTPASFTPDWLYSLLSDYFSATFLDAVKLKDRGLLNVSNFDLLILPYGEAFPYEAYPSIKEYLFEGGGLFNVAGRPFWAAMEKIKNKWQKKDIKSPYKDFLAPLGIKYYELLDTENIGLGVTTSTSGTPIIPTHGNVFPYRIPAREFYSLGVLGNKKDEDHIVLIKSWQNPYIKSVKHRPRKWCLIGARGENHPLNPGNPHAKERLMEIAQYLSSPVIICGLETDLAAYRQKEKVKVSLKIMNCADKMEGSIVEFEFFDKKGDVAHKKIYPVRIAPGQTLTLYEIWQPKEFKDDFYKISAVLLQNDGQILDRQENGFVVIDKKLLNSGLRVSTKGNQFLINGKTELLLGINYYESSLGELMWVRPNILKIRKDFEAMRMSGINYVRMHYHHSKWFRDYFANIMGKEKLDPYFQVVDTAALPSERSLRILDAIIQLAQEQGLIFCMDIFSLVPEDMGNPVGWLGLKERIIDADKIAMQKKFVKVLANRYKEVPGITWDLWNEPRLKNDDLGLLRDWARQMKDVFRENGDNHLITVGDTASLGLLDVLDYASLHTYGPGELSYPKGLDKPFIFQEVWNDAGFSLNEEARQAEELKKDFRAFLNTEAAGFAPWQWTSQSRLWDNASDMERWDDELGLCVHDDGTLKSSGAVYPSLISTIKEKQGNSR